MSKTASESDRRTSDFIPGPTKDRVIAEVELAVTFKVNTEASTLRQFYEQLCLKYRCADLSPGGGWIRLLDENFRPVLENVVQQETRQVNAADLNNNHEVITRRLRAGSGPVAGRSSGLTAATSPRRRP